MAREVLVTFDFGLESITARSRIGPLAGPELCWEAPAPAAGGPLFWATEDCHALVLEALAVMHFPNVDRLVLALPASEVEAHRARLEQAFTGNHDLRNTECRSQRLAVHVRRVSVVPQPLGEFLPSP
jgi:hypothetical protein